MASRTLLSGRGRGPGRGAPASTLVLLLAGAALAGCGGEDPVSVAPDRDCSSCHTPLEHAGRFSVLAHETTASGEPFRCLHCHGERFGPVTSATCLACHREAAPPFVAGHTASWGEDCLACHDGRRFSRGPFDHAAAGFPLEGLHRPLACTACHAGARSIGDFRAAASACAACHAAADVHDGAFGDDCGVCHDPGGWADASFRHPFTLDHHRETSDGAPFGCADCHGEPLSAVTSATCLACHRGDDPASVEAHVAAWGESCLACHDGVRFSGGAFDHAATAFPLLGGHTLAACTACHPGVVDLEGFSDAPVECAACHAADSPHEDLFGADCGVCHDPTGWEGGQHVWALLHDAADAPACTACHPAAADGVWSYTCYGCHRHDEERTLRDHLDAGVDDVSDDCMSCHPA